MLARRNFLSDQMQKAALNRSRMPSFDENSKRSNDESAKNLVFKPAFS
jgi:hypothetical protein